MKKLLISLILMLFAGLSAGYAYEIGGFQDNNSTILTVSEALKVKDDTYVTLKGNIIRRISNEKYMFKDSTGSIVVKIKDYKWMGQTVDANDTVEISGEIDKDLTSIKLDVNSIRKLK
ncbi:YgiW/YdeI family stress tolerance OB fold protein [bacterium]|nr:YgiW/YdeI family stress tolerance OB fold protein [bacterium]